MRKTMIFVLGAVAWSAGCQQKQVSRQEPTSSMAKIAPAQMQHYVTLGNCSLRMVPTSEGLVPNPLGGDEILRNSTTQLLRGMEVQIKKMQDEWVFVETSAQARGWLHVDDLLAVPELIEGTVLHPSATFKNPGDTIGSGVVTPGELVFVIRYAQPKVYVQTAKFGFVWMNSEDLVHDADEVGMSHLIIHGKMAHQQRSDELASDFLDIARLHHPESPLLDVLAEEVDIQHWHVKPIAPTSLINIPY